MAVLTWTAATDNVGVTGYKVYRNGVEIADLNALTYDDSAAPAGKNTYYVKAYDAAGNLSTQSNSKVCDSDAPPTLKIDWDYFITHTVTTNTEVRAYLKDDVILPFTGGDETQFGLKVNGSPVVFINFGIHYAPGASYVTLRNPTDFLPTDVIEFSYTAGADPIEGENTGTFAPDLVDQLVENTIVGYTYLLDDYPGAAAAYSVRKLRLNSGVYAIEVRRDNDNATTKVELYDDPNMTIDLDSIVEAGGTFGDWVGVNSAFIRTWYDQSGTSNDALQLNDIWQPDLVSAGILEGGILFGTASSLEVPNSASLQIIGDMSAYFVLSQTVSSTAFFISKRQDDNNREYEFRMTNQTNSVYLDSSNLKTFDFSRSLGTKYLASYDRTQDTDVTIYTNTSNSGPMGLTGTDLATNVDLILGARAGRGFPFIGHMAEIILWPINQNVNRSAIETDINNVYNIWVVTAEVDAQLIQADNDNVSDTVIEINGVRSSASDTAVANLIGRNVTVITN